ncbi:hypothetical protein NN561_008203 [Cricetulus griseus]
MHYRESDHPARAARLSNLICARQKAPALAFRAQSQSRSLCRIHPGSGAAAVCVRAGRGPESSAACEGVSVPGLPVFVTGARRIFDSVPPAGNVQSHPHAALYRAPESAGRREEWDPPHCQAPAQLPHQAVPGLMRTPRPEPRAGRCPDRDLALES